MARQGPCLCLVEVELLLLVLLVGSLRRQALALQQGLQAGQGQGGGRRP
jgi:hypothetical protein